MSLSDLPSESGPQDGGSTSPVPNSAGPVESSRAQRSAAQPARTAAKAQRLETTGATGLMVLLLFMIAVIVAPYLIGRIQYQLSYNELRAGFDVASEELPVMKTRLNDFVMASRMVAKRVGPSVVSIDSRGIMGLHGQGSGVIVDEEGYIITNYHVVRGEESTRIRLSDGRSGTATVVGTHPIYDLAVLKIDMPNLIAAPWGDSDALEVGDLVWAMGSPFGLDESITFGIVSAKGRRSSGFNGSLYQEFLQTDAAVNPGNSGGPLVDLEGTIVGINSAIVGDSYQGISFAIPSSLARKEYERMREQGRIEPGFLGIAPEEVPEVVQQRMNLDRGVGVYVRGVEPGTPAARAGLQKGDVILKWNEHMAKDPMLLSREIEATEVGSRATITVLRPEERNLLADSARVDLEVIVGRHPSYSP